MKKLNLLCIALALVLTACSSDDDGGTPPNNTSDVAGTWIALDVLYSGQTVAEAVGQTITSDFVGDAFDVDYTLTFSENPNVYVSEGSYSVELTTTTLGQTQVFDVENLEFVGDGEWSRNGSELSVTFDGETNVMTILELTDTTLRLGVTETEDLI